MPFICCANANIPKGTLQVLDLLPNTSLRNQSIDPPGQTRYINRADNDDLSVDANAGTVSALGQKGSDAEFKGLQAYLVDKCESGGLEQASATITLTGVADDDVFTVGGVFYKAAAAADHAQSGADAGANAIVFAKGDGTNGAATGLAAAINATKAEQRAIAPANYFVKSATAVTNTIVISAWFDATGAAEAIKLGKDGDLALTSPTDPVAILIPTTLRLGRTNEVWTDTTLAAAAAAILNLVDTGAACTLAAVDALLANAARGGCDLSGADAASGSVGTLAELLGLLSGDEYAIPKDALKYTAAAAPDSVHVWTATLRGGFTRTSTVFDTQMSGGEIVPTTPWVKHLHKRNIGATITGGDTVTLQRAEARNTYDTAALQNSAASGQLKGMSAGVTLFPDSDLAPWVNPGNQPGPNQPQLNNQRLVTVYNDDGTVIV